MIPRLITAALGGVATAMCFGYYKNVTIHAAKIMGVNIHICYHKI
jgi:hypothetical protein